MARLNKRQLKKARKKRVDLLFKNASIDILKQLLANQLRHYKVINNHVI